MIGEKPEMTGISKPKLSMLGYTRGITFGNSGEVYIKAKTNQWGQKEITEAAVLRGGKILFILKGDRLSDEINLYNVWELSAGLIAMSTRPKSGDAGRYIFSTEKTRVVDFKTSMDYYDRMIHLGDTIALRVTNIPFRDDLKSAWKMFRNVGGVAVETSLFKRAGKIIDVAVVGRLYVLQSGNHSKFIYTADGELLKIIHKDGEYEEFRQNMAIRDQEEEAFFIDRFGQAYKGGGEDPSGIVKTDTLQLDRVIKGDYIAPEYREQIAGACKLYTAQCHNKPWSMIDTGEIILGLNECHHVMWHSRIKEYEAVNSESLQQFMEGVPGLMYSKQRMISLGKKVDFIRLWHIEEGSLGIPYEIVQVAGYLFIMTVKRVEYLLSDIHIDDGDHSATIYVFDCDNDFCASDNSRKFSSELARSIKVYPGTVGDKPTPIVEIKYAGHNVDSALRFSTDGSYVKADEVYGASRNLIDSVNSAFSEHRNIVVEPINYNVKW